jgi:hypothetical protein
MKVLLEIGEFDVDGGVEMTLSSHTLMSRNMTWEEEEV